MCRLPRLDQGIPVIDADTIARAVVEPGQPAHREIAQAWPEVIAANGQIDRKKLGAIVFADARSRARLEAITHPRIREQVTVRAAELAAAGHGLAFLEAALLVETGFYKQLDGLVVVAASEEAQLARVMARDACSRERALARIRVQHPLAEKDRRREPCGGQRRQPRRDPRPSSRSSRLAGSSHEIAGGCLRVGLDAVRSTRYHDSTARGRRGKTRVAGSSVFQGGLTGWTMVIGKATRGRQKPILPLRIALQRKRFAPKWRKLSNTP